MPTPWAVPPVPPPASGSDAAELDGRVPTRPFPLVLAERARRALHVHAFRDAARFVALLVGDALVLTTLRAAVQSALDVPAVRAALVSLVNPNDAGAARELLSHASWVATTGNIQAVCAALLGLAVAGTYRPGDPRRDPALVVAGGAVGVLLNEWGNLWELPSAAPLAIAAALVVGLALAGGRIVMDQLVQRTRRMWDTPRRALIVGKPWAVQETLKSPVVATHRAFTVIGTVDALAGPDAPACATALGGIPDMPEIIARHEVETVILAGALPTPDLRRVVDMADAAGCSVFAALGTESLRGFSPEIEWHGGEALVRVTRPAVQARHLALKRAVDVVGAGAGLILALPLLAVVALAVRLSSRGPILFRQVRVGRGGRHFRIYKFRSMVVDAEARKAALAAESLYGSGHLFKMTNDPRVTRVGAVLRKTSLDELPQLWNVLVGDMSLVGPRPPLPSEVDHYDAHHFVRLCMRPGITGPWQVSGRNSLTDFERIVQLEHDYMRAWSITKDLTILMRTVPAVLQQRGAH